MNPVWLIPRLLIPLIVAAALLGELVSVLRGWVGT